MHVNKCNKIGINIMKDNDRKFISHHKMREASNGPKYLLQNKSALSCSPSHLSPFSVCISFGVPLRAPSTDLILGNLFDLQGLTSVPAAHHIITITGSLRLKKLFCQWSNNAEH
jgi:hypothetical protein